MGSSASLTAPTSAHARATDRLKDVPADKAVREQIRAAAVRAGIPCITTIEAGEAAAAAIASEGSTPPRALQDLGGAAPAGGAFRPGRSTL